MLRRFAVLRECYYLALLCCGVVRFIVKNCLMLIKLLLVLLLIAVAVLLFCCRMAFAYALMAGYDEVLVENARLQVLAYLPISIPLR